MNIRKLALFAMLCTSTSVLASESSVTNTVRGVSANPEISAENTTLSTLELTRMLSRLAIEEGLDKTPEVKEKVALANMNILARAYVKKIKNRVDPPSQKAIGDYYKAHPELFSQRAVYRLQEISIAGSEDQLKAAQLQYTKISTMEEMVEWLSTRNVPYKMSVGIRKSEDLPMDLLMPIAGMELGQVIKVMIPNGMSVIQLTQKRIEPVSLEQASPAISKILENQMLGEMLSKL